jgi:RNA polymerase sigma factor (sigma-70 family)
MMGDDPGERCGGDEKGLKPMDAAVRRALVESHRDLLRFLQRRLGSEEEAEEVLQRFMLKAISSAGDLRNVKTVRAWLGRVLATTIVDFQRAAIRRRRRERTVEPDELSRLADLAIEPDAETDEAVCDCLYQLLPTMKPEYAEVIWRADLLGEPRDRLAISLGTSVNNVTVRLHRARQALKIRLEQMCRTCVVHGFLDCRCDKHVHAGLSRISGGPPDADWGEGTDGPEVLDRPQ